MPENKKNNISKNSTWGGRFSQAPSALAANFTDSQHYDKKLYAQDIKGSIAHARMLGKQRILSQEDAEKIIAGLTQINDEIEKGGFIWQSSLEDVHMNIESRLIELIGDTGKKLHTARSRNDQVGLTFRLYVSEKLEEWLKYCYDLCAVLVGIAEKNQDSIMPGYTHMQPAQPVTLAQHLMAYANMFKRDCERIKDNLKRVKTSPLGAAALAGTTYPVDPDYVAELVDFPQIYANSMDAVSDRDFVLEALFTASLISMHLSRLCEEYILWASPQTGFIKLADEFSTGSSIMPQKKNPDIAELMRGKTGRVYGNLMAMLTTMKGLPMTYNRDLQEDKEPFFDTSATIIASLEIMAAMLEKTEFNSKRMFEACKAGYLNATEMADYLVSLDVPFRDAHHMAGCAVAKAESLGLTLEELPLDEFKSIYPAITREIYHVLDYKNCIGRRKSPGGTGPDSIRNQLRNWKKWLRDFRVGNK